MLRLVSLSLLVLFLVVVEPAEASWHAGMIYDFGFGADIPQLDSSSGSEMASIGFVHLPVRGGYLFFTLQPIGGAPRIVVTRFNEDGTLDTAWKNRLVDPYATSASDVLDLPEPDFDEGNLKVAARVAVGAQDSPAADHIYLAELCGDGGVLIVTDLNSDAEVLRSGVIGATAEYTGAIGSIESLIAGVPIGDAGTGVLVAIQGSGAEAQKTVFLGAAGPTFALDELASHSATGFRTNQLIARPDGNVDVVGSQVGKAAYLLLTSSSPTPAIGVANTFDLLCPDGSSATSSALDDLTRLPPGLSDDDLLVLGRVDCDADGRVTTISRVLHIEQPADTSVSAYAVSPTNASCTDPFDASSCPVAYLAAVSSPTGPALALTPAGSLDHLDTTGGVVEVSGDEANAALMGLPTVLPTEQFGAYLAYPYLISMTVDSARTLGLRRIAVDRIFADGAGDFGL